MTITYETKCWEGDWQKVLTEEHLGVNIARCNWPFEIRSVTINNVVNRDLIERRCKELVGKGLLNDFCFVDDVADEVLKHFGLSPESFGDGYVYSIAELTAVYRCRTEFLLHFSSDTMVGVKAPRNWLADGLKAMSKPKVAVYNLTWNEAYHEAEKESVSSDKKMFYGYGFSDQMFLCRAAEFKEQIYGHVHPDSSPFFRGEIFEKRVDGWMRTAGRLRATAKEGTYYHPMYGR